MDGQWEDARREEQGSRRGLRARIQGAEGHIWRSLASGFLVLIPLIITIMVVKFLITFVDGFFRPLPFVRGTPYDVLGIGVVFSLVLLYVIGAIVLSKGHGRVAQWQNAVMSRVPVVKGIYGVAKQTTDALSSPTGHRFSRVVFIEWPRVGYLAIGFVTGRLHSPSDNETPMLAVYIPTVPNPTSGNLAFVPEGEVIETDLTVEDAMKVVFSGGIIFPDTMLARVRGNLPNPPVED